MRPHAAPVCEEARVGAPGWQSWLEKGEEFSMCWSEAGEEPLKPVKVEV